MYMQILPTYKNRKHRTTSYGLACALPK